MAKPTMVARWGTALGACLLLLAAAPGRADGPAPDADQARFEVRFLTGMIDHHQMAVMMAELCEGRATHQELLDTCVEIKTTQMAEIEQMQQWLQDWYGLTYEPQMSSGHHRMVERLAELEGAAFETEFMKIMIRHHWGAIVEARKCIRFANHEELASQCHEIIAAQSAEIIEMQGWLCDWYGICGYGPDVSG